MPTQPPPVVARGPKSIYTAYMEQPIHARVFWSGGSQAVRLPKAMRLPGAVVRIRRRGKALLLEPLPEQDDWEGFWDRLAPLRHPLRRWPTGKPEKRRSV